VLAGREKFILSSLTFSSLFHPVAFTVLSMSHQDDADVQHEEHESTPSAKAWKSIWTNNKGVFLIILAQAVGSTMDAIVRFLQQGGHGMHPFQVSAYLSCSQPSSENILTRYRLFLPA
jgi:hypothetical protein